MAEFKKSVITDKGRALSAKILTGELMSFTKVRSSDHTFEGSIDFEKVTSIPSIRQEVDISNVDIINQYTVNIYTSFNNELLVEGYYFRVVGLYALDPDEGEILYSISVTDKPDYMPPNNGVTLSAIDYQFVTSVSNSENVVLDISPSDTVTKQEFDTFKNRVIVIDNTVEALELTVSQMSEAFGLDIEALTDALNTHEEGIHTESKHGLRILDGKFEFFNGVDWKTVETEPLKIRDIGNVPLRVQVSTIPPTNIDGRVYYNSVDKLFYVSRNGQWWRLYVGGDQKLDQAAPLTPPTLESKTDTSVKLVEDPIMEFRYQTGDWQESSVFNGLNRNQLYNFESRLKETDVYKVSPESPALAVTTDKGTQIAPSKPTVSNIEFDRATVTGGNNTEVKLDSGAWFNSPHTFTGLTELTGYTAYSRKKETDTLYASPDSVGTPFTTIVEQQIYGFEVDETNVNPRTAVTYIGDAVGKTPMRLATGVMGYGDWEAFVKEISVPVVVKNGLEQYKLKYDDYTQKELGGTSVLTGIDGDVFTKLSHLYMKYTKTTNGYRWEISTKTFPGATSLTELMEDGYNQLSNPVLVTLQNIYLLLFKDRDSQTALGRGYVDGNSTYANTGGANSKTFFFGETTGKLQMKFLGIEDFWGNKYQWVDGLVSDTNWDLLLGDKNFNDAGTGYTKQTTNITANTAGYFNTVQGGNAGYVLADKVGSETTGYADYGYLASGRVAYFGGYRSHGSRAGAFLMYLDSVSSNSVVYRSARLCFKNTEAVYVGAYLGFVEGTKLRSISGKEPSGDNTIGSFRTKAQANN